MFKDTKEGQTHFYGDNCGEPEHNPLSYKSVEIIKEVVNRFLGWKLPKDFNPDCGISFDEKHEPVGTNLFTATQAEEMVRFILTDTLLSERKQAEEVLSRLEEKLKYDLVPPQVKMESPIYWKGYEDVLAKLLSLIKKAKEEIIKNI